MSEFEAGSDRSGPARVAPSRALRVFHVILVLTAIAFAMVYGVTTLRVGFERLEPDASRWPTVFLATGSFAGALGLAVYLRAFVLRPASSGPASSGPASSGRRSEDGE